MLESIFGYSLIALLTLIALLFCFVTLYVFISEHETDIKAYVSVILCIIGLFSGLIFLGFKISKTINPPETIEVEGYTYHICDDVPDETIEQYGHKRLIKDYFERNPDGFDTYGVHVFAGEQGSGKSIAAAHFIKMIKERNPCCRIASNINLNFQDSVIHDWTDILSTSNGEAGQVIFLDEIQNWFSSNESKNFPPEMLTEITQQRKQRKIVVGTSQVFTRISKPIREQITLLYKPMTIAGCFTIAMFIEVTKDISALLKLKNGIPP